MTSSTNKPTIVETIKIPAKTDCGIEYNIVETLYEDGSRTVVNAPYIPEAMKALKVDAYSPSMEPQLMKEYVRKVCTSQDMTGPFEPRIAFNTRYIDPKAEEQGLVHACKPVDHAMVLAKLIEANEDKWSQVATPDSALMGWFVGQAMKATSGKANPNILREYLEEWKSYELQVTDVGC